MDVRLTSGVYAGAEDLLKVILRHMAKLRPADASMSPEAHLEQCLFRSVYVLYVLDPPEPCADGFEDYVNSCLPEGYAVSLFQIAGRRVGMSVLSEDGRLEEEGLRAKVLVYERCLQRALEAKGMAQAHILISSSFRGLMNIRDNFVEVVNSVAAIVEMDPDKQVVSEYDVRSNPALLGDPLPRTEIERRLVEYVLNLEFDKAQGVMEDIIEYERRTTLTKLSFLPRMSKRLEWVLIVLRVPRNRGDERGAHIYDYPNKVYYADSIGQGIGYLRDFFRKLDEYYSSFRFNTGKNVGLITDFIRENCADPDLNATMICDRFRISPSYLSHMFKQKTGLKLIDFIHLVRIEAVKKLLTESSFPISAIAARTGYLSSGSLTRSFKRYEGLPPGEYRDQRRSQDG